MKKIIFMFLIIITCISIFWFSSQPSDQSSNTSGRVVNLISSVIPSLKNIEGINVIVRKISHFSIYTILGIFTMNFALTCIGTLHQKSLSSILFGLLYAISDEIHQSFVYGRDGNVIDVFLDLLGVIFGITLVLLVHEIISKKVKKKIDKNTKIMFISSTGGHFSELMQLKELFSQCNYYIVTEKTKINENLKEKYAKKIDFLVYGTKKHKFKYIFVLIANSFLSLWYYLKFRPAVVITTGTHTAGPMCCIAKILGSKVIYIETFANRNTKTQTGKLLYFIADTFVIQWDELQELYPKAKNFGWIY